MDWGKMLGAALGGLSGGALVNRWMSIEDEEELRNAVRFSIRGMSPETIKLLLRSLEDSIHSYTMLNRSRMRDQAIMVRDVLLDEAGQR